MLSPTRGLLEYAWEMAHINVTHHIYKKSCYAYKYVHSCLWFSRVYAHVFSLMCMSSLACHISHTLSLSIPPPRCFDLSFSLSARVPVSLSRQQALMPQRKARARKWVCVRKRMCGVCLRTGDSMRVCVCARTHTHTIMCVFVCLCVRERSHAPVRARLRPWPRAPMCVLVFCICEPQTKCAFCNVCACVRVCWLCGVCVIQVLSEGVCAHLAHLDVSRCKNLTGLSLSSLCAPAPPPTPSPPKILSFLALPLSI